MKGKTVQVSFSKSQGSLMKSKTDNPSVINDLYKG